jgi:hypothetical protein
MQDVPGKEGAPEPRKRAGDYEMLKRHHFSCLGMAC